MEFCFYFQSYIYFKHNNGMNPISYYPAGKSKGQNDNRNASFLLYYVQLFITKYDGKML